MLEELLVIAAISEFTERNQLWLEVNIHYAVSAAVVLLVTLLVRIAFGASPGYLMRTRCYELPPLRFAFHALHLSWWAVCVAALAIGLRYAAAFCENPMEAYAWTSSIAIGVALVSGILGWCMNRKVLRMPNRQSPAVNVRDVETISGIDSQALQKLGSEQFPQMLAYGHKSGILVRYCLTVLGLSLVVLVIAAATKWGDENGLRERGVSIIAQARSWLLPLPHAWAISLGLSASLGLMMLFGANSSYTLIRFPTSLLLASLLVTVIWSSAAALSVGNETMGILIGVFGLVGAIRSISDLRRAAKFSGDRRVALPIASRLSQLVPDLATLKSRPDCQLPQLDKADLRDRITRGCRNVEEHGALVTRNFARFLSLVSVEYEHFSASMLRFLTVRRYVATRSGGGTHEMLRNPIVPMWDEGLFPLRPPTGFRNWLDPLWLGHEWDIISICGGCGGSGQTNCTSCHGSGREQRTETYTEYSNGQNVTRTRTYEVTCSRCGGSGRVTCSNCGGAGRVAFYQVLNTQWQRFVPTCTAPEVIIPDLMEDAEERTYCRVPFFEARARLKPSMSHDGIAADLQKQLYEVSRQLSAELPSMTKQVERLHDGVLYRADFQVTAFWVLRILFRRLPGKVGWFFGHRPEFYFPTLPLGWGLVGTVLFIVPFAVMTFISISILLATLMNQILPPLT